mmetsp:Transcript_21001/g.58403  ORF Transcript_21001/g.58403 Transcript_21001/m.58403 type:complete len:108 (-) Transcript_21001:724-1047(-)
MHSNSSLGHCVSYFAAKWNYLCDLCSGDRSFLLLPLSSLLVAVVLAIAIAMSHSKPKLLVVATWTEALDPYFILNQSLEGSIEILYTDTTLSTLFALKQPSISKSDS